MNTTQLTHLPDTRSFQSRLRIATLESRTSGGSYAKSRTEFEVGGYELDINHINDVTETAFEGFLLHRVGRGHKSSQHFRFEPPDREVHEDWADRQLPKRSLEVEEGSVGKDEDFHPAIREVISPQSS